MPARRPAEVFPPGEFLRDELEERGWTQQDLAEVMGRPAVVVSEILAGKRAITPDTAKALADALDQEPEEWMKLDAAYQLWKSGVSDSPSPVAQRARIYRRAPIREMQRRGWIVSSPAPEVLEQQLLSFLRIPTLEDRFALPHAASKTTPYHVDLTGTQEAWLAAALGIAEQIPTTKAYSNAALKAKLPALHALMGQEDGLADLPAALGSVGVRLVPVQALTGCKMDGATFWPDTKPVIAHSARYDRLDRFWFVLMHEVNHVLEGEESVDENLLSDIATEDLPEREQVANSFAAEHLVPQALLEDFMHEVRPFYSGAKIAAFAAEIGVHPSIVIGQLQRRKEIDWAAFRRLIPSVKETLVGFPQTDGWGRRAFA